MAYNIGSLSRGLIFKCDLHLVFQDDSALNEIEDNRINHQLQTLDTHVSSKEYVGSSAEAPWLRVPTKEQSDKQSDAGVVKAAATELVNCPEKELVPTSDVLASCAYSVMTASDIANQNVNEDLIIPSQLCAAPSSIDSKNRVNSELNVLEDKVAVNTGADTNDIVFRRQRIKKKRNGVPSDGTTKVKRVSFHEDFIRNESETAGKCGTDFSVSFLPPNFIIKRDAVKGRYSWCAEGDAPFMCRRSNESDTKSDIYLSSSTLTSSDEIVCMEDRNTNNTGNKQMDKRMLSETAHAPPVAERGIPEGQEDPPSYASSLCLYKQGTGGSLPEAICRLSVNLNRFPPLPDSVDWSSDSESIPASDSEFICSRTAHLMSSSFKENHVLENSASLSQLDVRKSKLRSPHNKSRKGTPLGLIPPRDIASKTSLLNRFMRSLTEKKFMQKPKVALKPSRSLYIPATGKVDHKQLLEHFKTELSAVYHNVEQVCLVIPKLEETFRAQVFLDPAEVLYRVRNVLLLTCLYRYFFVCLSLFLRLVKSMSKID